MHRQVGRAVGTALAAALVLAVAIAACSAAAPAPTPSPTPQAATSAAAAFAAIQARTPWFDGVKAKDPSLIGEAAWWEATQAADGWTVAITVGWGDCQAGCINRHAWTWHVAKDGTIAFVSETGPALPEDQVATLNATATSAGVGGVVTAGPVCPVMRIGDTSCDPRPVTGAILVVRSGAGAEMARVTTDGSGPYRVSLPPGDYSLEPQPVKGLMGTAPVAKLTVLAGKLTIQAISYDTGIR
jgi:hypothetical protein